MINYSLIVVLTICGICTLVYTEKVKDGEFNYVVSIWHNDEYKCGGAIISKSHILTTAFLVNYVPSFALTVIAGTISSNNPNRQILRVKGVHTHYGYQAKFNTGSSIEVQWMNDIAILELEHQLIWYPNMEPIRFITEDYDWLSLRVCMVPEWKYTVTSGQPAYVELQWTSAVTMIGDYMSSWQDNEGYVYFPTENETLSYDKGGSPIVCDTVTVGMIISARAPQNPRRFLNIVPYLDFINNIIDMTKNRIYCGEIVNTVSIWHKNTFVCTGTILTDLHIITAADCIWNRRSTDLRIVAGYMNILPSNPRIVWTLVDAIIVDFCIGDVAILTLAEPLALGQTINQAIFADTSDLPIQRICRSYQWRRAYTVNGETLLQLVWVPVIVMDATECKEWGVKLKKFQSCARNLHSDNNSNIETSGNPIVCDGDVFGIMISRDSMQSASSNISIFFAISPYKESIATVVSGDVH